MPRKSPKQLFRKLFYRYTVLVVCIVLALTVYFISSSKSRILETNLKYRDMMAEEAAKYLEESSDTVRLIHEELYQSSDIQKDLIQYFQCTPEEYQKYRLDMYMASQSSEYEGFDDFAENAMQAHSAIQSIEFISYDKEEVTTCYSNGKVYIRQNAIQRMEDVEEGRLAAEGSFSFVKEIRSPDSMTGVGCMIVNFGAGEFYKIQNYYPTSELIVCNQNQTVIFPQDSGKDVGKLFMEGSERGKDDDIQRAEVADYSVFAVLQRQKASRLPVSALLTIIGISIGAVLLGEWCVRIYLKNLTVRLNEIIDGMQKVTTGDLSTRLMTDKNGDELDVISGQFNEMCQKLERYIEKSYLAEIEQKNAEMEVLQNQINPHFLYNTLEAIRMKAICNGDREVGKMLYSMSVIFRSQLKDSDIITLIQEMHYCKKYLELFEYRYQGKFTSSVECPEELMDYPVMKFILQPIVENYFIHGIRGEQKGNFIRIWAQIQEDALMLHVEDNGKGMDLEELKAKNAELTAHKPTDKKSVGIHNVNSRVRALYGEGYGVTLLPEDGGGLHVLVRLGISKGEKV